MGGGGVSEAILLHDRQYKRVKFDSAQCNKISPPAALLKKCKMSSFVTNKNCHILSKFCHLFGRHISVNRATPDRVQACTLPN